MYNIINGVPLKDVTEEEDDEISYEKDDEDEFSPSS